MRVTKFNAVPYLYLVIACVYACASCSAGGERESERLIATLYAAVALAHLNARRE
jgi:hypothetical protein